MGLRIQTNIPSLFGRRQLGLTTQRLNQAMERISSGYRINKAADDAAGLAISENLRSSVRSLNQAKRNALDGVSLVQTAEGGLNEITNIVVRLRELAIQSASDTLGPKERGYLQREFGALKDEIDRIANSTEFNGTKLLVGMGPNLPEEVMTNHNPPPLEVQVGKDYFSSIDGLNVANPTNIIRIDFSRFSALTDGDNGLGIGNTQDPAGTRVDTKQGAQLSINHMDEALTHINEFRANLGAIQNRLQSTISNLGIQVENLESAKSRIKDADYAEESAMVSQQNILQQAGTAVLAQANQMPKMALKLLENL